MSKLSDGMVKILRAVRDANPDSPVQAWDVKGPSLAGLRRRFAVKQDGEILALTPTGRTLLAEHERAERTAAERAERKSRPVPSSAFVEPSARTAPVLNHEYEDEYEDTEHEVPEGRCPAQLTMPGRAPHSCDRAAGHEGDHRGTNGTAVAAWDDRSPYAAIKGAPETKAETYPPMHTNAPCAVEPVTEPAPVPESWVRQLVTLLDADGRIVKTDRGWRVDQRPGSAADAFLYMWERLDVTVNEAIRLGIAQALPPTPGQGVVRLALTDKFRQDRAAERGVRLDARVTVSGGRRVWEVARIEEGMARVFPLEAPEGEPSEPRWITLERLEPAKQ
jgi:hypothetical protein